MEISNKKTILLIILFFTLIGVWVLNFNYLEFLQHKDCMDYSQMGRELARGNGFSTLQIFPSHLKYFKEKGLSFDKPVPNLYRFPLPVISNAIFYKITGNILNAGIIQSGFWMLMTIPIIFIIIYRLSGIFLGILGSIIFFLDNLSLSYSGLGEPLTTFLLIAIFYFVFKNLQKYFLIQGMLIGLLFLSRSVFIFILPLLIIFYLTEKIGLKKMMILTVGFLIISGGWFIRNYSLTGSPMFSFTNLRNLNRPDTGGRIDPFYTLDMEYSTMRVISKNIDLIVENTGRNMSKFFSIGFWKKIIFPFAPILLLSIIFYFFIKDRMLKRSIQIVFLTVISTFLIYTPFLLIPRWFSPVKPVILITFLILISKIFTKVKEKFNFNTISNYSLIAIFSVLMVSPWILGFSSLGKSKSRISSKKILNSFVNLEKIVKGKVVLSDISHRIAMFCDTLAIRIPIDPNDIEKIDENYAKIDYIVLSKAIPSASRKKYRSYLKNKEYSVRFEPVKRMKNLIVLKKRK